MQTIETQPDIFSKYNELKEQLRAIKKEKNNAQSLKIMNDRYANDPEYKERRKKQSYEYYQKKKLEKLEKKNI